MDACCLYVKINGKDNSKSAEVNWFRKLSEGLAEEAASIADPNYKPSDDPEYQGAKKVVKQLYNKVDPTQIVQLIKKSECMDLIALALQGTAKTHPERLDENGQPTPAGVLWLMETVQHAVDGP
jgi:hypothetical protein